MNDNDTIDRAKREADAQALSDELQRRIWNVLNDGSAGWARAPHCTAHGIAEVLTRVLVVVAKADASLAFGLNLFEHMQRAYVTHAGQADAPKVGGVMN